MRNHGERFVGNKTFGLIIARKGSTRLTGKNSRLLAGRPLFRWTLEAALDSGVLDYVVISTDDEAILDACEEIDGVISEKRPPELSTATVPGIDVLIYTISRIRELNGTCETFCLLQPTSPFRGPKTIRRAMAVLQEPGVEFAVGIAPFESPPFFAMSIENGLHPTNSGALTRITRTQDVPVMYHPAGGLFAGRIDAVLRERHFYGSTSRGIIVDQYAAWDINSLEDFEFAENLAPAVLARRSA
jgi:CMP-N-acetylneuraminic acid synthetase